MLQEDILLGNKGDLYNRLLEAINIYYMGVEAIECNTFLPINKSIEFSLW